MVTGLFFRSLVSRILAITIVHFGRVSTLGINCRGSILCPLATWNNAASESVIQVLRDAVWDSTFPNATNYNHGDHIICVSQSQPITIGIGFFSLSGNIKQGGICLFPEGTALTLGQIRPLTDAVLKHGCTTCGSVPIHFVDEGNNDPSDGILKFDYVQNPFCVGNCISDTESSAASSVTSTTAGGASTITVLESESAGSSAAPSIISTTAGGASTITVLVSESASLSTAPSITSTTAEGASTITVLVSEPAASTDLPTESTTITQPPGAIVTSTPTETAESIAIVTITAPASSSIASRLKAWNGIFLIFVFWYTVLYFL